MNVEKNKLAGLYDEQKHLHVLPCCVCGKQVGAAYIGKDFNLPITIVCSTFNGKCIKEFQEKVAPPRPTIALVGGEVKKRDYKKKEKESKKDE